MGSRRMTPDPGFSIKHGVVDLSEVSSVARRIKDHAARWSSWPDA